MDVVRSSHADVLCEWQAVNIIGSLGIGALLTSYTVSIGCIAIKRLRHEPLLPSSFTLGRAGLVINLFAVTFMTFATVMVSFTFTALAALHCLSSWQPSSLTVVRGPRPSSPPAPSPTRSR